MFSPRAPLPLPLPVDEFEAEAVSEIPAGVCPSTFHHANSINHIPLPKRTAVALTNE